MIRAVVAAVVAQLVGVSPVLAQDPGAAPAPTDTAAPALPSPGGAFLRSLVVPGWGQAYVGVPGRGAAYFALEAGSVWMTYKSLRQRNEARERQQWLRETGQLPEDEKLGLVESREEQFEDWLTLSIFLLLFSGADAYVMAQLADFDEHVGVRPEQGGGLRLEARVPLGRRR